MSKEKILTKKLRELNILKGQLVERSDKANEEIINEIKDTIDDLQLILQDFDYINSEGDIDKGEVRGDSEYTLDEVENYKDEEGNPKYEVIDGVVYDVSEVESLKPSKSQEVIEEKVDETLVRGSKKAFYSKRQRRDEILTKGKVIGWVRNL